MRYRVVSDFEIPIEQENDLVDVRIKTKELARQVGFDSFAVAAAITAASELSRNIWTHAGCGKSRLSIIDADRKIGLKMEFEDHGPGIADLDRALAGGNSTIRSLGLGLSGTRRLMDEFQVDSKVGEGTTVSVIKWKDPY